MNAALSGRSKLEIFFGLYVFIFSLVALSNELLGWKPVNYPSVFVSIVGITGAILLYRRNRYALKVLNGWSVAQLVYLYYNNIALWDVAQVFSFNTGFTFGLRAGGVLEFGVNPVAILLIYCVWKLNQRAIEEKNLR